MAAASHLALVPAAPAQPLDSSRTSDAGIASAAPASGPAARQAFCSRLKAARERRGITLAMVASATKVSSSHFAALERGDISRWPKGLYRRAFFRSYATAIGLPPESTVDEFQRLFEDGEPERVEQAATPEVEADAAPLRLTMAEESRRDALQRICSRAALADAVVVLVIALALAWWSGAGIGLGAAIVGLCYYPHAARTIRKRASIWRGTFRFNRT